MEVTHIEHQNTHAIIGGYKPEAFEVEDNAEFYEMLSSTLYPNKKLAVVREVLCNSWDAHLMVGKNDVPVEVTITDKEMSFKDFGPGIGRDQIIKIYCTYGKSTKSHDGKQTGGFGLGSKSPFAYSKHFTVVSCHDGKRAIYAASRGSSETNGKPDFRAMAADIPTEETGITVTIPLLSASDKGSFERLVKDLAYLGGMNVRLNGFQLFTFDYSKANWPFVLMSSSDIGNHHRHNSGFFLRYGAVVYPVDTNDETIAPTLKSAKLLSSLAENYCVVLLAEPNTIGVAPSRETLSYTDKTSKTIVELVENSERLLRVSRPSAAKFVLKHIADSAASRSQENPFRALAGTIRQRYKAYSRACDVLYHNRMSVPTRAATSQEIARALAAVSLYRRDKKTLRNILDDTPDEKLFQIMRKAIRKANSGLKRYLNQIETPRFKKSSHDDTRMEVFGPETSLGFKLENSLRRMKGKIEAFDVKVAFGKFYHDGFVEDVSDDDRPLASFAQRLEGFMFSKKFTARPKHITQAINAVFAPSRLAAKRWRETTQVVETDVPVMIVLTRKKSDVEGAMKLLETYGIATHDARDHAVQRVKQEVSSTFYMLPRPGVSFGENLVEYDHDAEPAQFYCYGQMDENRKGEKLARGNLDRASRAYICNHIGPVVIAMNAADARSLGKKGLRNVYEKIAEDIVSISQSADGARDLFLKTSLIPEISQTISRYGRFDSDDMKSFLSACEDIGVDISKVGVQTQREKDLVDLIAHIALNHGENARGKFGFQFALLAIGEARKNLKERFARIINVTESDDFKSFLSAMDSYYASGMNRVMRLAVVNAAIQSAAVQFALKPKTN